jgi:serine/threonine protein kinase
MDTTIRDGKVRIVEAPEVGGERYVQLDVLGRGGMGEVRLCHDRTIGRDVALKVEIPGRASRSRFVREALVQGQLEHPAIVPVYDVSVDAAGTTYFTMKRVQGVALNVILEGVREKRAGFEIYTRHKLLAALARVCLAIDFAHARDVVHRDLKPANLMLGVWGEVYILDWGIARVQATDDHVTSGGPKPGDDPRVSSSGPSTAIGSVIGTAGYLAPEQVGSVAGATADIYALGVILFEILTNERLHAGKTVDERLASTVTGETHIAERLAAHNAPPELAALCERATSLTPSARHASARELGEAIERYLEGDRDLERRRELANEHVARGEKLATDERRGEAMRELSRAFALDPDNPRALAGLVGLLSSVPKEVPPEVDEEVDEQTRAVAMRASRTGIRSTAGIMAMVVLAFVMGVRSFAPLVIVVLGVAVTVGLSIGGRAKMLSTTGAHRARTLSYVGLLLIACGLGRIYGSLVFVPSFIGGVSTVFVFNVEARFRRYMIVPGGLLVMFAPLILEKLGVLSPSYAISGDDIVIIPHMASFGSLGIPALVIALTMSFVFPIAVAGRTADSTRELRRSLNLQRWHLRQLLPDNVRPTTRD